HYLFKWPWWIYRNSFKNIKYAYNKNVFRVSIIGAAIALFLIQFAYWVEIASELNGIKYIGIVLALLPIAWVFGEISSIRARDLLDASWIKTKANYENGMESARSLLYFIFVFVILFVIQVSLNVLGWIPKWGITLASITLNINVIISFLLIVIAVIIYFATLVLPTYRLFNVFNERSIADTWMFLKKSLSNILHYIFFVIPTSFFGIITAIIPIILVSASLWLTIQIKNNFIEHRISELQKKQVAIKDIYKKHVLSKKIDELILVQKLPTKELLQYMIHKDETDDEIASLNKRIVDNNKSLNSQQIAAKAKIDTLQAIINQQKARPFPNEAYLIQLETQIKRVGNELDLEKINVAHENKITKIDIDFLASKNNKLILIFYCVTLLLVVCGSAILASFLGYLGNVLYDVYVFRNDNSSSYIYKDSSTYIIHTIREEKNKNHNQPLLSTTLNAILFVVIIIVIASM
ncbi:MAG: hypothetical protein MI922_12680, partial [Bacteroidales bacterium]|nr:hypothetical protein [Bacteroidales bacterium]